MALHTLGTNGTTQLACLPGYSQVLAAADVAAIQASIAGDGNFGMVVTGALSGEVAVLATATTAGSTSLTSVTARTGSPPITIIRSGDMVLGSAADFVPGTFVVSISGTTVTLSQAAVSSGASKAVAFARFPYMSGRFDPNGFLYVPRRGVLQVLPGDVIARDSTGWPILISANSIAYAGSDWTFT